MAYFSENELHCLDVSYGIAVLERLDSNLTVWKVNQNDYEQTVSTITAAHKDLIIVFMSYNCYNLLIYLSRSIKKGALKTKIIVCHSLATMHYETILCEIREIDVAVLGEYEETLCELCRFMCRGDDIDGCRGIAYFSNGEMQKNAYRPLADVDKLLFPKRCIDKSNMNLYHIYGSRGCEGHCTFCDRNTIYTCTNTYNCVRLRSIKNIIEEIDLLVKESKCKFVSFSNPTFISSSEAISRLDELCSELSHKDYWIQFMFNVRAEQINEAVVESIIRLKKYGLGKVFIGIESFNEDDLRRYGKRADIKDIIKCISILKAYNINKSSDYNLKIEYGFINFNPYSTVEKLQTNIGTFRNLNIPLNPYIIASKMTVNSLTPISKKISADNLYKMDISSTNLCELLQYSFDYKFINSDVEKIYGITKHTCERLHIHNDNGLEFIRNRYFHYCGCDLLLNKFDVCYKMWSEKVDSITYALFTYILANFNSTDIWDNIESKIMAFTTDFAIIDNRLRVLHQRMIINLKKINELIHYRSVFN